jgi:hypothetical protein
MVGTNGCVALNSVPAGSVRLSCKAAGGCGRLASPTGTDFDGDGWPDLAVANSGSNDVSILLNDGAWNGGGGAPGGGHFPGALPRRQTQLGLRRLSPATLP